MTTAATDEDRRAIRETLANARRRLLAERVPAGHWEGELSSSALSTATASFALHLYARSAHAGTRAAECARLAAGGVRWLAATQNVDGGWGDTTRSRSNISTTVLCWATLRAIPDADGGAVCRAESWLRKAAGSLRPEDLSRAISARYGDDRTFSVPILTLCAAAGVLGEGRGAWRHVAQLPFELAAVPQAWFRFLRLPVVSYALPALIAMGLVRHVRRPTPNPLARLARRLTTDRTLSVLSRIQPEGGGFLEATPLTSFVALSLVTAGHAGHPVVTRGVDFLARSVRADGSWPIDTNLATWVTTLSVNALSAGAGSEAILSPADRAAVRTWLLAQQHRVRHPYTGADPGGWAWTDLPGGVPDADDTAGALIALSNLGDADDESETTEAAAAGVRWLLSVQNRDGGVPTFCRGWGRLPFDRSAPEITAHALTAWSVWRDRLPRPVAAATDGATERAIRFLRATQRPDGSWVPLWFGNESADGEVNPTYGTARVVAALRGLAVRCGQSPHTATEGMVSAGVRWLVSAQNSDGGWGGAPGVPSSVEETSQAVVALAGTAATATEKGVWWLAEATQRGVAFAPSPLGLYFARLWYFERLYPLIGAVASAGAFTT